MLFFEEAGVGLLDGVDGDKSNRLAVVVVVVVVAVIVLLWRCEL